jgi:diaminopimelate decarboxylase
MHFNQAKLSQAITRVSQRFSSTMKDREATFEKGEGGMLDARFLKTRVQTWSSNSEYLEMTLDGIVWDHESDCFVARTETVLQKCANDKAHKNKSIEQKIKGNCVLENDITVDVTNRCLIFPNGSYIDGPTGQLFSVQGVPMVPRKDVEKDC